MSHRQVVAALVGILMGCGESDERQVVDTGVTIQSWLSDKPTSGVGTLNVQISAPATLELEMTDPDVQGLRFTELGDAQTERMAGRVLISRRFRFSGKKGHYEIGPQTVGWQDESGEQTTSSSSIFVDLQVDPISVGELSDISEPDAIWSVPNWFYWGAGGCGLAVLAIGGGSVLFGTGRKKPQEDALVPPDLRAIRQWEAVQADMAMNDLDRSVAIARILRDYVEAVFAFPATGYTTSEILNHLGALVHLPEGNLARAERLLRATDRIKFTDESARSKLFEDLDNDLRAFVGSTRPHGWEFE